MEGHIQLRLLTKNSYPGHTRFALFRDGLLRPIRSTLFSAIHIRIRLSVKTADRSDYAIFNRGLRNQPPSRVCITPVDRHRRYHHLLDAVRKPDQLSGFRRSVGDDSDRSSASLAHFLTRQDAIARICRCTSPSSTRRTHRLTVRPRLSAESVQGSCIAARVDGCARGSTRGSPGYCLHE